MHWGMDDTEVPGFPIQRSQDQRLVANSPGLIAGSNVFHRLLTPSHPPHTLSSLITPTCDRRHKTPGQAEPIRCDDYTATHRYETSIQTVTHRRASTSLRARFHSVLHSFACNTKTFSLIKEPDQTRPAKAHRLNPRALRVVEPPVGTPSLAASRVLYRRGCACQAPRCPTLTGRLGLPGSH